MHIVYVLYIISLLIVITTFLISAFKFKNNNLYIYTCYVLMIITICGYISYIRSTNVNEAILANKLTYVGAIFIPILLILHIFSRYYKTTKLRIALPFILLGSIIFIITSSVGFSNIFYYNVSLEFTSYGIPYFVKDVGPGYYIYIIYLVAYAIYIIGLMIFLFRQGKVISYKNLILLLSIVLAGIIVYFSEKVFDIKIELMPFLYTLAGVILLLLIRRINRYNVYNNISNSYKNTSTNAYILFDLKLNYLGCSTSAIKIIPELANQYIDHQLIIDEDDDLLDLVYDCIKNCKDNNELNQEVFSYDKYIYKCIPNKLLDGNKTIGYYIELIDDTKQQNYIRLINKYNANLEQAVSEKTKQILEIQEKFSFSIANLIENRDSNTGGHIQRTSNVMRILVDCIRKDNFYNVSDEFLEILVKAAPMHDLGKICIDDRILNKPCKFNPEECEIMKTHSKRGAEIIEKILKDVRSEKFIKIAKNIAYFHHEKWDGSGYPNNLSKEDIPLEARIMALADVYDALVSKRCYKEKYSFEEANKIILESMGTHFDPSLESIYLKCREKLEEYYKDIDA